MTPLDKANEEMIKQLAAIDLLVSIDIGRESIPKITHDLTKLSQGKVDRFFSGKAGKVTFVIKESKVHDETLYKLLTHYKNYKLVDITRAR